MHTATQLNASMFEVAIEGQARSILALLPGWHAHDRFGIVVTEPLGSLGASLLTQAAITVFHDFRRENELAPTYPEIYLFHVGGRWGNHSGLDAWPPRKEVFVANDPLEVLMAINDRGVTRLAVPSGTIHSEVDWQGIVMDYAIAKERITSIYCYGADGIVKDADVRVSTNSNYIDQSIAWILDPRIVLAEYDTAAMRVDPYVRQWIDLTVDRMNEVPAPIHAALSSKRLNSLATGGLSECYRRIDFDEAARLFVQASV